MKIIKEKDLRSFIRDGKVKQEDVLRDVVAERRLKTADADHATPDHSEMVLAALADIRGAIADLSFAVKGVSASDPRIHLAIREIGRDIRGLNAKTHDNNKQLSVVVHRGATGKIESLTITAERK